MESDKMDNKEGIDVKSHGYFKHKQLQNIYVNEI